MLSPVDTRNCTRDASTPTVQFAILLRKSTNVKILRSHKRVGPDLYAYIRVPFHVFTAETQRRPVLFFEKRFS